MAKWPRPTTRSLAPPLKPEQAPSTYNSCSDSIFAPCFVATGSFYRPKLSSMVFLRFAVTISTSAIPPSTGFCFHDMTLNFISPVPHFFLARVIVFPGAVASFTLSHGNLAKEASKGWGAVTNQLQNRSCQSSGK